MSRRFVVEGERAIRFGVVPDLEDTAVVGVPDERLNRDERRFLRRALLGVSICLGAENGAQREGVALLGEARGEARAEPGERKGEDKGPKS